MGILIHIITIRIKRIFQIKEHPLKTLGVVLFFIISILYGYLFSNLYNSHEFQDMVLSQNDFEKYAIISLAVITFLRGFFPSYIPVKNVFAKNYPLSKLEKLLYNITNEFIYPFYLAIIFFIVTFSIGMNNKGLEFSVIALAWVLISHLIKRIVQLFIEFQLEGRKSYLFLFLIFAFMIFYFISFTELTIVLNHFYSLLAIIVLVSINYKLEENSNEHKAIVQLNKKIRIENKYYIKLLFSNKSLRAMSITALAMKILLFISLSFFQINANNNVLLFNMYVSLVFSPLLLFTYIFNNYFGFSPPMWLSMYKVGADFRTYSIQMFKVLIIPLLFDAVLSISFYIFTGNLKISYISFYIGCSLLLFIAGVFNSFFFPKQIKSIFSIKGSTSVLGSTISIIIVVVVFILGKSFPLSSLLISIILTVGLYYIARNNIPKTRYKIFQKLFY